MTATSATNAWAAGFDGSRDDQIVIENWNCISWILSHSPVRDGSLFAVAAAYTVSAWAVGSDSAGLPLIEHWNSTRWIKVTLQ